MTADTANTAASRPFSRPSLGPVGLVLLAAMLWGTTGTAQHFAPGDLSAYWVGSLRMLMAALFFVGLSLCVRPQTGAARPPRHMARILFCGLCMAAYNLSFFAGVRACGVALGTALAIGSGPIWAGFMQAAVHRRWPGALWWLGTCIGVGGGIVMALASAGAAGRLPWHGMALCLLAGMSYAAYALANQDLVREGPVARVNAWVFGCAALMSLPFAALLGGALDTGWDGWAVVIYLGVVATGFAYLLFSMGLRGISVATGVALSKAEPITAFVLSLAVVGERPAWWAVPGLAAVIAGLWLVVRAEMREAREFANTP
jgi:DME family drug/metabolite transporter